MKMNGVPLTRSETHVVNSLGGFVAKTIVFIVCLLSLLFTIHFGLLLLSPTKRGYVLPLSVCLSVCLTATLLKKLRTDFDKF